MQTPNGIEITGPIDDRFEEILSPRALELVCLLHRELGERRQELLAKRGERIQVLADGGTLDFLTETRNVREDDSWRVADPAPGLVDRRVEITGRALSVHNGREPEAQKYARALIDAFEAEQVEWVVVNAAGCGSTMKEYADLLSDDPRYAERARVFADKVRDVSEILVELGPVAIRHPLDMSVAYHDACQLGHAQGVRSQPRELLTQIPGLELREIAEGELCCGSAGIYNILNPEPARELGDRKATNIVATGAQLLVTANPGCLMQVASAIERSGHPMGMAHTVEVLDASIRGLPVDALTIN